MSDFKAAREAAEAAIDDALSPQAAESTSARYLCAKAIDAFLSELSLTSVVVPRKPTEAMVEVGSDMAQAGYLGPDVAKTVYRAMIEAASRSEASGRGE